jgi:hypothetical protein
MTNPNTENQAVSQSVVDMFTVANEFCLFTEKAENYQLDEVIQYYSRISALLYLKGSLLPAIGQDDEYTGERFVNEDQWENIFNSLQAVFGQSDTFVTITHEIADNQPLKASIAEHITDIYQDLKDFVILYSKNLLYAKQNAVYECRELFITHWGLRLVALLPALHNLAYANHNETDLLD